MKHPDDPIEILHPASVYHANDLLVWNHPIPGCEFSFGINLTSFPNPVVHDDMVVACTFSPGFVEAVDKATGEYRWRHSLLHLGTTPISAAGFLFVGDSRSVESLSTETGLSLWKYKPFHGDGETIIPLPVYANNSVYIGDREGQFVCLWAETGELRWSVQTSRSSQSDVNATALAFDNLIITATNAQLVLAYDQATGQQVWRKLLIHRCLYQIQLFEGMALVRTSNVLYGLSPKTGEIVQVWRWRGKKIKSMAVAGSVLCIVISNEPRRDEKIPVNPKTELLGISLEGVQWRLPYPRSSGVELRWDPETRLLYEAMNCGLGIVDPETGKRLGVVTGFSNVISKHTGRPDDYVGLPSTDNEKLYVLHTSGTIWALRHPAAEDMR